jgi:hypothetical protein
VETKSNFLDEAVTLQIGGPTSPANVGFWPIFARRAGVLSEARRSEGIDGGPAS